MTVVLCCRLGRPPGGLPACNYRQSQFSELLRRGTQQSCNGWKQGITLQASKMHTFSNMGDRHCSSANVRGRCIIHLPCVARSDSELHYSLIAHVRGCRVSSPSRQKGVSLACSARPEARESRNLRSTFLRYMMSTPPMCSLSPFTGCSANASATPRRLPPPAHCSCQPMPGGLSLYQATMVGRRLNSTTNISSRVPYL